MKRGGLLQRYRGSPCPYCGREMQKKKRHPTRDHVKPKKDGHTLENGNRLIVCYKCNQKKGGKTLEEFLGCAYAIAIGNSLWRLDSRFGWIKHLYND